MSALTGLTTDGQLTEVEWPYGNPLYTAGPPAAAAASTRRKSSPWRAVGRTSLTDLLGMLQRGDAVILSVWVVDYVWFDAATDGYIDAPPGEPLTDLHAVLAVGLTSMNGTTVVEFKNSWGTGWGDAGYGYLTEGYWTRYVRTTWTMAAYE